MSMEDSFDFARFMGIILLGMAALVLAIIASPHSWSSSLETFIQSGLGVAAVYIFFLVFGAVCLSVGNGKGH